MTTRTVTGRLLDAKNLPLANLEVTFKLNRGSFSPGANYPAQSEVKALTDTQGNFTIDLWVNTEGSISTIYLCRMPDGEKFSFNLPAGSSPVDIQFLRAQNIQANQEDPSILAYIDQRIASNGGGGIPRFEMNFNDASLSVGGKLPVLHNKGVRPVSITVFNNEGTGVVPDDTKCENLNTCAIDLASFRPLVGSWSLILGF
jgi:hypothetical protein